MNRTDTIKLFTDKLRNKENFFFIKIGDDCVFCMNDQEGSNGELHPYSEKLGAPSDVSLDMTRLYMEFGDRELTSLEDGLKTML